MPAQNLDHVKAVESSLAERLAKESGSLEREQLRALKKKVRRAQRKRRRLAAEIARRAAKTPKPAADEEKSE